MNHMALLSNLEIGSASKIAGRAPDEHRFAKVLRKHAQNHPNRNKSTDGA